MDEELWFIGKVVVYDIVQRWYVNTSCLEGSSGGRLCQNKGVVILTATSVTTITMAVLLRNLPMFILRAEEAQNQSKMVVAC